LFKNPPKKRKACVTCYHRTVVSSWGMMSANQGANAENMEMELRAYCEPPPITIFKHLIALSGQIQP
jgi:hypothetical protein